jgi:hypothetical protein
LGNNLYMPDDYSALRTFYGKLETKDQESVVLKLASAGKTEVSVN